MKKLLMIFILLGVGLTMYGQQTVRGTITGADDGEALIGVSVMIEGTTTGTVTDFDGNYELNVPSGGNLLISYTGYDEMVVPVNNQSVVDIAMKSGVMLDEVVVTSLGMARTKKALGYSVEEIKGESFQEAREINIGNALAGKIAGVNVSSIASGPAGSSRVIIRGNTSLGGNNQPLYVIDGVPMDNSGFGQSGLWGGADEGDGMSSVNPDDIETMTVLKGANAAALYGSRASNGVILITTKSGVKKKGLGIEFNTNIVAEQYVFPYEFQETNGNGFNGEKPTSADEAWNSWGSNWGPELDGSQVPIFSGELKPYTFEMYNNLEKFYNTGTTLTNSLGFTQAGDDYSVRLNFSDLRSKAITPNQGFDRQNVSLSYRGNFADRVEVTSKVLYSHEFAKNRPRVADSPGNAFQAILRLPANYNIDDLRGDPDKPGAIPLGFESPDPKGPGEELQMSPDLWNANPYWAAYQHSNNDVRDRIITSNVIKFNLTDYAYIQGRFSMDWYTRRDTDITPYGTGYQRLGSIQERERRIREVNIEGLIGVNHRIGDFTFDGFVGGNRMRRESETLSLEGSDFNIPFFHQVKNAQNQVVNYGISQEGINSVLGSATVGYGDFVYLTATARNDWFSTLNPETNSILYPSIGGTLVFSELLNLPSNHPISFGKFRASWAQVGGDTDPYRLLLTYGLGNGHLDRPTAGIQQGSIPNPLLKPLTSSEIELGFDMRFLKNRLGVDFTWYSQKTTDDILNASIAESSGFSGTTINIGEITNQGVELLLSGTPIQKKNFSWDVGFNFAFNDSKVVQLAEGLERIRVDGNLGEVRTRAAFVEHIVGQPFGTITGFVQERNDAGVPVFNNANGQPVRTSTAEILGNGVARYTGGITNDFQIGPIHLDVLVDFKAGSQIYSGSNSAFYGRGYHQNTVSEWSADGVEANGRTSVVVTGVDQEGNPYTHSLDPETEIPGFYGAYAQLSDRFIRNGSFAKLRQLSAGYSLPQNILDSTPLQAVRISLVARNLFILFDNIENVDAESTYNNSNAQGLEYYGIPASRNFGFNLKATF